MTTPVNALRTAVREFPSALLGFSGGVDSALLAVVLRQELGPECILAVIGRSASLPAEQWEMARAVAAQFDVPVAEVDTHELDDPQYLANPTNRCFFCKNELWRRLRELAAVRGFTVVCDGTNADDLGEHRPGHAAGVKAGVRSPLAEAGLSKNDVRAAARSLGLPNWDAPAAPCLSSRVQYGLQITPRRLRQVEQGEALLRGLGVRGNMSVRHQGDSASIEVEPEWIPWLESRRAEIAAHLHGFGFEEVAVDPRGYRRGSLLRDLAGR